MPTEPLAEGWLNPRQLPERNLARQATTSHQQYLPHNADLIFGCVVFAGLAIDPPTDAKYSNYPYWAASAHSPPGRWKLARLREAEVQMTPKAVRVLRCRKAARSPNYRMLQRAPTAAKPSKDAVRSDRWIFPVMDHSEFFSISVSCMASCAAHVHIRPRDFALRPTQFGPGAHVICSALMIAHYGRRIAAGKFAGLVFRAGSRLH
jgi:hypothetical protein